MAPIINAKNTFKFITLILKYNIAIMIIIIYLNNVYPINNRFEEWD